MLLWKKVYSEVNNVIIHQQFEIVILWSFVTHYV